MCHHPNIVGNHGQRAASCEQGGVKVGDMHENVPPTEFPFISLYGHTRLIPGGVRMGSNAGGGGD